MIVHVAGPMDAHNSQTVCVAGPMDAHNNETVYQDPWQHLCLMLERLIAASMFDAVACALAYKGWKPGALAHQVVYVWQCSLRLSKFDVAWLVVASILTRSMCACAQRLLCCALAHKASLSDTCCLLSPIVVVVIAFAWRKMKMPCACAWGLVINTPKALLSTFAIVVAVVVVIVAVKHRDVNALGLHWGPCHWHVVAAVINSLCACAQWLINSSCACAQWLMDNSCACALSSCIVHLRTRALSSTFFAVVAKIKSLCACARWLIARIVVCYHCQMTTHSAEWSSCTCAWGTWHNIWSCCCRCVVAVAITRRTI